VYKKKEWKKEEKKERERATTTLSFRTAHINYIIAVTYKADDIHYVII
jgi:hypothetical protein